MNPMARLQQPAADDPVGGVMGAGSMGSLFRPVEGADAGAVAPISAKGRRTRARLLDAARVVFERDGFLEARVADIATEAAVSHGTFYTYFDSKTAIFRTVVSDVMEKIWHTRVSTDGNADLSPYARIERANRQFIRVFRENLAMMALHEQVMTYDDEMRLLRLTVRQRSVERVCVNIEQLQADGVVPADLDAFCAASALVSMVSNFTYFWLAMEQGDYDEDVAVETLTRLWASALGLRPD
jgi:AcrR family transcriptional regulator